MNELERTLISNSAAAPPAHILEGISQELAHRKIAAAPRTIYEELWHIAFWLRMTLEWIDSIETPYPERASVGFPEPADAERESWSKLCERFLEGIEKAAAATRDDAKLERIVRCPSAPGAPVRTMTVREQLESLTAHNSYHFGRIVLLRQIAGEWPPASGGDSW
jgi:uncharacterized damage-inducible protein DinB